MRRMLGVLIISLAVTGVGRGQPAANDQGLNSSMDVLDKQQILESYDWWDNKDWSWYKENIPFFEAPDARLQEIYYYRWEVVTKHLVYGSPQTGYTFTEFMDRPFWSGTYGAISCPLGHQLYEVRWLKNDRILNDFVRYWFETPGAEPRSYSNWYGDSIWGIYKVSQDDHFLHDLYPYMVKQYNGFVKEHFNRRHGLFMWDGMHDGMEMNINGRQTDNEFSGGDGYRPTLNSYMYADLMALAKASDLLGKDDAAAQYREKANQLKTRVQEQLWDPGRQFFFHQFAFDELNGVKAYSLTHETGKFAGSPHGREAIGFVPWQFNLPDAGYETAWQYLMDEDFFYTKYGPTTTEQGDPMFKVYDTCCKWSGNSWPYATTQTLVAMANLLNNYDQDIITTEDYVELLRIYANTQYKDGRPYIAEAANPYTGSWEGHDKQYHSEHYFHSGYVNNVITGLVGLRPQAADSLVINPQVPVSWDYFALEDVAYHGHNVSIVWDRTGDHYGRGQGLLAFVDGELRASSDTIQKMTLGIESVTTQPREQAPANFAVNNRAGFYPYVSASSSQPEHSPFYAVDGNYWYHQVPANRWVSETGNAREWVEVNFGVERPLQQVKLYFIEDGDSVSPPEDYQVQVWKKDRWQTVASADRNLERPTGRRANTVTFNAVQQTSKLRVVMQKGQNQAVGLTELEAWGPAEFPLPLPVDEVKNLAYNPDNELFPTYSASYTSPTSRLASIGDMDGFIPPTYSAGTDRWSTADSPNTEDWIEINFGPRKEIRQVDIQFWGSPLDSTLGAPQDYSIKYWQDGEWKQAAVSDRHSQKPQSRALNRLQLESEIFTNRLRILFEHKSAAKTAVSEIMVWEELQ